MIIVAWVLVWPEEERSMDWKMILTMTLAGAISAARTDWKAYQAWAVTDKTKPWNWKLAAGRIIEGAIAGMTAAVIGAGAGAVVS